MTPSAPVAVPPLKLNLGGEGIPLLAIKSSSVLVPIMVLTGLIFKMLKALVSISKSQMRRESLTIPKKFFGSSKGGGDECPKKAAIVLSGSGHLDGSCIVETMSAAIHLARMRLEPVFYAPACPQADVVDHRKGCPVSENRCAITESARLARGKICPLTELRECDAVCVIFPGGFGAAKTLSTFEQDRANCSLNNEVLRVLEEFHDVRKPMAFICIAAVLPARVFPCVKVTLGRKGNPQKWPYQYAIDCAAQMGAEVEPRPVDSFSFDKQHMVFSTPAFMYDGTIIEIFDGIGNMITNMAKYID